MRLLCTVPEAMVLHDDAPPDAQQFIPCNLTWLPTGRAVSYRLGDALWVADVEGL